MYADWLKLLETYLQDLRPDVELRDLDPNSLHAAWSAGTTAPNFAQQSPLPLRPSASSIAAQPFQPAPAVAPTGPPPTALKEYARQHKGISQLVGVAIAIGFLWPVTIILLVLATTQSASLRRKVAELGSDADKWERPLEAFRMKCVWIGLAVLAVQVCLFIVSMARHWT